MEAAWNRWADALETHARALLAHADALRAPPAAPPAPAPFPAPPAGVLPPAAAPPPPPDPDVTPPGTVRGEGGKLFRVVTTRVPGGWDSQLVPIE